MKDSSTSSPRQSAAVRKTDSNPEAHQAGAATGTLTVLPARTVPEESIDWNGFARLETYHSVARSCGAYAVFYGAMAGQELIKMKQRYGNRKFLPALRENAPWMAESTAYLYIGYAKRFQERIKAIAPTAGVIDLAALPDPRDFDAAQKSELFKQVHKATGINDAGQMWLALGLAKAPKNTGGDVTPRDGNGKLQRKDKRTKAQIKHDEFVESSKLWFKQYRASTTTGSDKKFFLPLTDEQLAGLSADLLDLRNAIESHRADRAKKAKGK